MGSQRAGNVVKTGLPQHGVVEQALDQNHFRIGLNLLPCVQAALGTRQETVRWRRRRKAAAIEIAFQWKDDPTHVCVVTHAGHHPALTQTLYSVTPLLPPPPHSTPPRT